MKISSAFSSSPNQIGAIHFLEFRTLALAGASFHQERFFVSNRSISASDSSSFPAWIYIKTTGISTLKVLLSPVLILLSSFPAWRRLALYNRSPSPRKGKTGAARNPPRSERNFRGQIKVCLRASHTFFDGSFAPYIFYFFRWYLFQFSFSSSIFRKFQHFMLNSSGISLRTHVVWILPIHSTKFPNLEMLYEFSSENW